MGDDHAQLDFIFPISDATLKNFLHACSSGVIFSNQSGEVLFANRIALDIFGLDHDEMHGRPLFPLLDAKERSKHKSALQSLIKGNKTGAVAPLETAALRQDGKQVPLSVSYNLICEGSKKLIFILFENISQHVDLEKKLQQQAITDPLTGLYNRRYFDERLFQEFKRANRYCRPFSVIIIDIDGFKQANDHYGHDFGDQMLLKATQTFNSVLREGDSIYRYGGDEFAMLLPETAKEGTIEVADRLRNSFASEFGSNEKRIRLSLSIGIASHPEDGKDAKALIGSADRRMYASKESGGNMVTAYDVRHYFNDDTGVLLRSLSSLANLMEKSRGFSSHGLNHSQNIRTLAIEIGHRLGLGDEKLSLLEQAAMLHDIGSISTPSSILHKQSDLSEAEQQEIRRHVAIGEEIIGMIMPDKAHEELKQLQQVIGQHHERLNGTGYPRGLKGDAIILEARILAVADVYVAMRSKRPYRKAMTRKKALAEMEKLAGVYFDRTVVDHLAQIEGRNS